MGKFQKGHPGGPGRPHGSRNSVNQMLDQLAEADAETMVKKMIEAAGAGDRVAARLVLNRIWSAPKGRAVNIEPLLHRHHQLVRERPRVIEQIHVRGLRSVQAVDRHISLAAMFDRFEKIRLEGEGMVVVVD